MSKFMHGPAVAGQSVVDRVLAAKHTVSGQSLAKVICKATTEEVMGPKRKHLDCITEVTITTGCTLVRSHLEYASFVWSPIKQMDVEKVEMVQMLPNFNIYNPDDLLQCTNEANVSVPEMANLIIERTQNANWVVVFKALITVHNLMNYGNERFTQYLASSNCSFNLSSFTDRTGTQGYDMSTYIRRYAKYLNEKALSYRLMAFDFCKVKRGKEDGILRTMNTEKLLRTLPVLQAQLDVLVEFDVSANELTNGVINACFMLLFKDLIRLFACYNDGIINLLEKYFEMNKKNCRDALDVYKKFLLRMDRVCEFLKVAENVGIDKGDIPDLAKAPSSLLEALEQHLASVEQNKKAGVLAPKLTSGVSTVISNYATASQIGTAPGAGAGSHISDDERRSILEEEQRQLDQMKQQKLKEKRPSSPVSFPLSSGSSTGNNVKVSSAYVTEQVSVSNVSVSSGIEPTLFASAHSAGLTYLQPETFTTQDNFLNSRIMSAFDASSGSGAVVNNPFVSVAEPMCMSSPMWNNSSSLATSQGFDYKDILQPIGPSTSGIQNNSSVSAAAAQPTIPADKLIKSDLDSSLASLAGNLNIRTTAPVKKMDHQWSSTNEKRITGSRNTWSPAFASSGQPVQVVGTTFPNSMSGSVQPAGFAPYALPTNSQFGQPYSVGWSSAHPPTYGMPQPTTFQLHSQPSLQQTMPNDPFGSL